MGGVWGDVVNFFFVGSASLVYSERPMKRLHNHLHRAFALAVCSFAFLVSACHKGGGSGSASKSEEGEFVLEEGRYLLPQSVQTATVSIEKFGTNLLTIEIDVAQVVNGMWIAHISGGSYYDVIDEDVEISGGMAEQTVNMDNDTITLKLHLTCSNNKTIEIEPMNIYLPSIKDESGKRTGSIQKCDGNYISTGGEPTPMTELSGATLTVTF